MRSLNSLQYGDDEVLNPRRSHFPTLLGPCHFAAAYHDYLPSRWSGTRCAGGGLELALTVVFWDRGYAKCLYWAPVLVNCLFKSLVC